MPDKTVLEPTAENMTEVAKTLHAVGERVKEVAERSDSERKEMEARLTGVIEQVSEDANKLAQRATLGRIADRAPTGETFVQRAMTDPGPYARQRLGTSTADDDALVRAGMLCTTMGIFAGAKGIPAPLTEEKLKRVMCEDSEAGRKAWAEFENLRAWGATDTEFASSGWVPTVAAPILQEHYTLALKVAALFKRIPMPHSPFEVPVGWARDALTSALPGEATDATMFSSVVGTGLKMTFTAKKLHKFSAISDEANWESIVAMVPTMLKDHADFLAYATEYAIINGDTTATHQDTDTEALGAAHAACAWNGLRDMGLADTKACATDVNTDPYKTSTLRGLRKSMGVYGVNPTDVALIVSPNGYIQLLSNADVKTADVFGDKATILQGQLASFDGHPVIVSEAMRQDMNNVGVNGASGNTFSGYIYVNRTMFAIGERLGFESKYSDTALMVYGAHAFISQKRLDFQAQLEPTATNSTMWYGYNAGL